MQTIIAYTTLVQQSCGMCGVVFGMSEEFRNARLQDHNGWYCPNGHIRYFTGKSEAEKLRDQLAAKEREVLAARSARDRETERRREAESAGRVLARQVSARKGVATRLRRKIASGACPCCSKKFKDLAVHMKTEHPKWDLEKHAAALEAKEQG